MRERERERERERDKKKRKRGGRGNKTQTHTHTQTKQKSNVPTTASKLDRYISTPYAKLTLIRQTNLRFNPHALGSKIHL